MMLDTELARARAFAAEHHGPPDKDKWSWDLSDGVWAALKADEAAGATHITYSQTGRVAYYRGIPVVMARNEGWALYTSNGAVITRDTLDEQIPAAAIKKDNMVEIPRNPLHFVIDDLSPPALNTLETWGYAENKPEPQTYSRLTLWMKELFEKRLTEIIDSKMNGSGNVVEWTIKPTFEGWEAIEHLRCGLYAQHRSLYLARAKRDADEEAIPGWGQF